MSLTQPTNGSGGKVMWEIIKWLLILSFLAGGSFAMFEKSSHADATYLKKEAFEQFERYNNERWNEVRESLKRIEEKMEKKKDK